MDKLGGTAGMGSHSFVAILLLFIQVPAVTAAGQDQCLSRRAQGYPTPGTGRPPPVFMQSTLTLLEYFYRWICGCTIPATSRTTPPSLFRLSMSAQGSSSPEAHRTVKRRLSRLNPELTRALVGQINADPDGWHGVHGVDTVDWAFPSPGFAKGFRRLGFPSGCCFHAVGVASTQRRARSSVSPGPLRYARAPTYARQDHLTPGRLDDSISKEVVLGKLGGHPAPCRGRDARDRNSLDPLSSPWT